MFESLSHLIAAVAVALVVALAVVDDGDVVVATQFGFN